MWRPSQRVRDSDVTGRRAGISVWFKSSLLLLLFRCSVRLFCDPIGCSPPGSSVSVGFSRQGYWSGLPFPSPGGSNPHPLQWRVVSFPPSRQGSPNALGGASGEMMLMCSRAGTPSSSSSCSSVTNGKRETRAPDGFPLFLSVVPSRRQLSLGPGVWAPGPCCQFICSWPCLQSRHPDIGQGSSRGCENLMESHWRGSGL